jgi:hypothetical protein
MYVVQYTTSGYIPDILQTPVGSHILFVNCSITDIRTASDPHPVHTDYAEFDEKNAGKPGTIRSFDFPTIGTFSYHNHIKSLHR